VVIPFGENWTIPIIGKEVTLYISDMNVAILYVLAISGLGVYGIIFGGWASNSKYALLGGLRSAAQMVSYEVALSFAAIGVVMMTNSLSLVEIVRSQSGGILNWNIFYLPVGPVWFAIFFIAGIAETNRLPFDLAEDEGTLAAGFHVEYSGMRFAFFMLSEYVVMVSISVLAVLLFFGGWDAPLGIPLPPIVWFLIKVTVFIYLFMWIRFTFPRYRYDQLMAIGWKILIPISLVNVLVTGIMRI
jgi:NADH-quinone oxidoreductase subunit H